MFSNVENLSVAFMQSPLFFSRHKCVPFAMLSSLFLRKSTITPCKINKRNKKVKRMVATLFLEGLFKVPVGFLLLFA